MTTLNILICGGGIAGPALAFWLSRSGHNITIVERSPALRAAGAQVDIREQGIQVVRKMGLDAAVRACLVDEAGMTFVDSAGRRWGTMPANKSGHGAQLFTSEYEIMRGDMVRVLYEATKGRVTYMFDKSVESFTETADHVTARFSDGQTGNFDVLVGADGQGSRIRKAMMPADAPSPYLHLGLHTAYFSIPRHESDGNLCHAYLGPGGRMMMRRSRESSDTQVYMTLKDASATCSSLTHAPLEDQKDFYAQRFRGAGWQTDRFIDGLRKPDSKFYCQSVVQVRTDTWSKGRVVLLGDAAHCASPFSGMGVTGALVGAYVLAGELTRHPTDLARAFAGYDEKLRPFVDEVQRMHPSLIRLSMPDSQWAINLMRAVAAVVCWLRIPQLLARLSSEEKGGWRLPDYPELRADS